MLDYFPMLQQNIWVQIVNFSSFPLKSGEEKTNIFYNKIGRVLVFFVFFYFFNVTFFLLRGWAIVKSLVGHAEHWLCSE